MAKAYKFIEETQEIADDKRLIEVSWTEKVSRKEVFTINELTYQLEDIDRQIAELEDRKREIQAKIDEAKAALSIK